MFGYSLTSLVGILIMWLVWKKNSGKFHGLRRWFTAYILQSIGQVLLLFQGSLPDFMTVVLANVIIFAAVFILYFGMISFTGLKQQRVSGFSVIAFSAVFYYIFTFVHPSLKWRIVVFSSVMIIVALHFIYLFWKLDKKTRKMFYEITTVFALFVIVYSIRLIVALNSPDHIVFYQSSSTDLAIVVVSQMLYILLTFSFVIVINNRLISDLNENVAERENLVREFKRMASIDALTGIYNRMKLEPILTAEVLRSKRYGRKLSVLLIDIDHFKLVNDKYGHNIGDSVLRDVAAVLKDNLRDPDQLGRWGGEEFLVVVPETSGDSAMIIAEKLRSAVEGRKFIMDISVTISIGIASLDEGEWEEDVIRRADQAMYRAKNAGRNRIA